MTYCVAIRLKAGLVLLADTRTNAGVDNIARFRKLHTWETPGERVIALMTAGNLAITQAVISLLQERIDNPPVAQDTMISAPSLFRVAELVGDAMREVQGRYGPGLQAMSESSAASIVVAGQRAGGKVRLFLVYSAGNFIEATEDTPFFQIGEHKYGKPILDRVISPETDLADAKTAALLSMDSTLRSNLTVGMPLDLAVIPTDGFTFHEHRRIEPDDPDFHALSQAWSDLMREAFVSARKRVEANASARSERARMAAAGDDVGAYGQTVCDPEVWDAPTRLEPPLGDPNLAPDASPAPTRPLSPDALSEDPATAQAAAIDPSAPPRLF